MTQGLWIVGIGFMAVCSLICYACCATSGKISREEEAQEENRKRTAK